MDLKFLLNPEIDITETENNEGIIIVEEDMDEIIPLTTIVMDVPDENFFINNYEKENMFKNSKIYKIRSRVRRVTKHLKIWDKNNPDEDMQKVNYVMNIMPESKTKKYTSNEILTIIIYMLAKDKGKNISLEQIIQSVIKANPSKKFTQKYMDDKIVVNGIKRMINSVEGIHNNKNSNLTPDEKYNMRIRKIEEISKNICDQMNYPAEIKNNIPIHLHHTENTSFESRNVNSVAAAYVQTLCDKYAVENKYFVINFTKISKAAGVSTCSIRKAYKILKELMK